MTMTVGFPFEKNSSLEDRTFKAKLVRYIDAGFPIIYINTFEEDKVDSLIQEIS